eukprot:4945881-Pleurochrysis_carterae.AAC.1
MVYAARARLRTARHLHLARIEGIDKSDCLLVFGLLQLLLEKLHLAVECWNSYDINYHMFPSDTRSPT